MARHWFFTGETELWSREPFQTVPAECVTTVKSGIDLALVAYRAGRPCYLLVGPLDLSFWLLHSFLHLSKSFGAEAKCQPPNYTLLLPTHVLPIPCCVEEGYGKVA